MLSSKLKKSYDHSLVEDKWYAYWMKKDYFTADNDSEKEPYTIVIPPPNVTGMLTVGHVLNNTIQDILIRKARMEGKEACWVPGIDHASIATEAKVVAMLKDKGIHKKDLTREEFLKYVWDWKSEYGDIIIKQLKKLGCSCDWGRERFTMDPSYSKAVLSAFVKLYEKGIIYKGNRIVNWCPVSKSAISDEEVIYKEINSSLWYIKYPIKDSSEYVIVATTRPETMLGDTAVAFHPKDTRYNHLKGQFVDLPLVGKEIPIITDNFVDPNFGTGCVKITPAHDPNDFIMGQRHGLQFINIMNEDASLNSNVPKDFIGLSREDARAKVVSDLKVNGLLYKVEDHQNNVGFSERGGVPIEFYISEQWFMKMNDLAEPAIEAVKNGEIRFHPDHWTKTYYHWMENIRDWCISRQLIWGHQIPVWYNKTDKSKIHVSVEGPQDIENWEQDSDVLDTWASSWLWPIAVHSWPEDGESIQKFYPTNTLVTGPDIIFFWVARMIITGHEFMNESPFKDVYFTSILRDSSGKKLSKSLGNSPNPLDLFTDYGTDAVRFSIMLMAPQGLDVLFSKDRLEIGRNFMNKLWNACRFIKMNLGEQSYDHVELELDNLPLPEKWVLSRLSTLTKDYNKQLNRFHFNEAAKIIYDFTWNDFCDWYVEIAKSRFYENDIEKFQIAKSVSLECIRTVLILLHPFSPFISEELWTNFREADADDIIVSPWVKEKPYKDNDSENDMVILKDIITSIRSIRSRMNISPSKEIDITIRCSKDKVDFLTSHKSLIKILAKVKQISLGQNIDKPNQSASAVVQGLELFMPLKGLIDLENESARLEKRMNEVRLILNKIESKLSNQNFLLKAPQSVIQKEKRNSKKLSEELKKLTTNLELIK